MASSFRQFIMRGNVVDLAVGVVIGAAFSNLVVKFTESFINPPDPPGNRRRRIRRQDRPGILAEYERGNRHQLRQLHHRPDHLRDHNSRGVLRRRTAHRPAERAAGQKARINAGRTIAAGKTAGRNPRPAEKAITPSFPPDIRRSPI